MPFLPVLVTLLSIASGVIGYRFAVTQAPAHIEDYVLANTLSTALQVLLISIASHRKDRLLSAPDASNVGRPLRVDLCVLLAAGLAALALCVPLVAILTGSPVSGMRWADLGVLAPSASAGETYAATVGLFVAMSLVGNCFQLASFAASAQALVQSPKDFWAGQLSGATVRLVGTGLLVLHWELAYVGILLANAFAAIAVCYHFHAWPLVRTRRLRAVVYLLHSGRFRLALSVDGVLRGAKSAYESLALATCVLAADRLALLGPVALEASYVAVGYLNTLATGLRQSFARWELAARPEGAPTQHKALNLPETLWLAGGPAVFATVAGALALIGHHLLGCFDVLLPRLAQASRDHIVWAAAVYLAAYPWTRGFLYADYLQRASLRRLAAELPGAWLAGGVVLVTVLRAVGDTAAPLLFLPVPWSIAWAIRRINA